MKMKAMMFYAPCDIRYEETEIKDLKEGEVRVKIENALTCGTDLKTYHRGHPVIIKEIPSAFGHEFSGVITDIAEGVENFSIGDRVVAVNSAPCGECFYCQKGQYNLCEKIEFLNGAYAEYINIPKRIVQKNMIKLDDELSFEKAAFTEPLANVVQAVNTMNIKKGDNVLVYGAGAIGLMFVSVLKSVGAKVTVFARTDKKLELAKTFGADNCINLTECDDLDKKVLELTNGYKFDVCIECVGLPETWELMLNFVRKGGIVQFFGGCKKGTEVKLDTTKIHYDNLTLLASFHHTPQSVRQAYNLIKDNKIPVEKLITHKMKLKDLESAFKLIDEHKAIKVLITP